MNLQGLIIEYRGGQCPYQVEGTYKGYPFYFRARGESWSIEVVVKSLALINDVFHYREFYGVWPSAGWITDKEADKLMAKGFKLFREFLKIYERKNN